MVEHLISRASLIAQWVKNPLAMQETQVRFLVRKIRWRKEKLPTPVFWPGQFHGLYSHAKSWIRLSDFHFREILQCEEGRDTRV